MPFPPVPRGPRAEIEKLIAPIPRQSSLRVPPISDLHSTTASQPRASGDTRSPSNNTSSTEPPTCIRESGSISGNRSHIENRPRIHLTHEQAMSLVGGDPRIIGWQDQYSDFQRRVERMGLSRSFVLPKTDKEFLHFILEQAYARFPPEMLELEPETQTGPLQGVTLPQATALAEDDENEEGDEVFIPTLYSSDASGSATAATGQVHGTLAASSNRLVFKDELSPVLALSSSFNRIWAASDLPLRERVYWPTPEELSNESGCPIDNREYTDRSLPAPRKNTPYANLYKDGEEPDIIPSGLRIRLSARRWDLLLHKEESRARFFEQSSIAEYHDTPAAQIRRDDSPGIRKEDAPGILQYLLDEIDQQTEEESHRFFR